MSDKTEMDMEQGIVNRDRIIVRTSIIGIVTNIFLASFKAAIGLLSHSIAVILDAVNNLSDVLSSVVTIVGTKLASKLPDKKHPLGHGRIEYLSAMVVAAIVLYAGITSVVESFKKIIHPEKPEYSAVSLVIIAVAIVTKVILGAYVKKKGEEVNSSALVASGADASFDAILSASVLASALLFIFTGINLEAFVGLIISIVIVKAGIEMMTETADDILGRRADPELSKSIRRILNSEPEVRGAYDLFINDYGPGKNYASVHLELRDTMTIEELDVLTRRLQNKVFKGTGVVLTAVGAYSYNTKDDEAAHIRNDVSKVVANHDWALQFHGFYVDSEKRNMRFDVVFSFDIDPEEGIGIIHDELKKSYPDYEINITPDVDITD